MAERTHKQALPAGTRLQNYRVVGVLGVGGFGVTYLAEHVTLGQKAAIKEYLPNEFAVREGATVHAKSEGDREDFEWGLRRFLDEAKTLARFEHRNVVRVRDYFEANRTAYIVMDYEEGEPLDKLLERHGHLTEAQLKRVLLPIVEGLKEVHAAGFLHRDIKPSNVYVRRSDESPVLLDFGAARQALGRKSKSLTAVASAGYSPPEQYESEGAQGPWTDIYSLSALCYRAITGDSPLEAPASAERPAPFAEGPVAPARGNRTRRLLGSLPGGGGLGSAGDRDRAAAEPGRLGGGLDRRCDAGAGRDRINTNVGNGGGAHSRCPRRPKAQRQTCRCLAPWRRGIRGRRCGRVLVVVLGAATAVTPGFRKTDCFSDRYRGTRR